MFILDFVDLYLFGCLVSICFGVLKCWLTGWVVLSGLIGAWFLYVIRWFNFSFGTHFGNSGWCFWWWVSILAALMVPWAPFFKVSGVFWAAFWELWAPFGSILRGLVASGSPWAARRWHSAPPGAQDQIFPN